MLDHMAKKIAELQVDDNTIANQKKALKQAVKKRMAAVRAKVEKCENMEGRIDTLLDEVELAITEGEGYHLKLKTTTDQLNLTMIQKNTAESENNKTRIKKETLESLCRSLQEKNRALLQQVKDISESSQKENQAIRDKFTVSLESISKKIEEQAVVQATVGKENDTLRDHLGRVSDMQKLQEEQHARLLKTKDLEVQIAEAKLKQEQEMRTAQEKRGDQLVAKMKYMAKVEAQLRSKIEGMTPSLYYLFLTLFVSLR